MIKIGIDARSLTGGPPGIATYVSGLLSQIPCLDPLRTLRPTNNFLWNQLQVPSAYVTRRWSAYHAAAYTTPLFNCRPLILTVHDICYLARPEWYPNRVNWLRRRYYVASLHRADRIIVPSTFTKSELLRLYPSLAARVRLVYQGVSRLFYPDPRKGGELRRHLGLPQHFILHVGDIHPRRNIDMLAQAAERLKLPLVLVGRTLAGGRHFSDWPHRYVGITIDQLRGLYSAASVLAYPSLYEGFGLPILEAMACGLPVIAANTSCLPEVCGDAALLAAPDTEAFVEGIARLMENAGHYARAGLLRAGEFSWARTARETESVYREVVPGIA